jgi:hypothetical protein
LEPEVFAPAEISARIFNAPVLIEFFSAGARPSGAAAEPPGRGKNSPRTIIGWPETVLRRGEIVVGDGKVLAKAGTGDLGAVVHDAAARGSARRLMQRKSVALARTWWPMMNTSSRSLTLRSIPLSTSVPKLFLEPMMVEDRHRPRGRLLESIGLHLPADDIESLDAAFQSGYRVRCEGPIDPLS